MPSQTDVSSHYTQGNLLQAIRNGLSSLGKTPGSITIDDLAPVDEFHIGGRAASIDFLDQFGITSETHVLDVGCGLGGTARFVAHRYGSRITGIDLTSEFVETGNSLCEWVGLEKRIQLNQGSALVMPFAEGEFDAAYMLHVGMNIEDKEALVGEVARTLRPGSVFGIYDVMQTGEGELAYPVPWAARSDLSALAQPARYKKALESAGFEVFAQRDRREFALTFFAQLSANAASSVGPPPVGLHLLMGESTKVKVANMIGNIASGLISPVEMIARKT